MQTPDGAPLSAEPTCLCLVQGMCPNENVSESLKGPGAAGLGALHLQSWAAWGGSPPRTTHSQGKRGRGLKMLLLLICTPGWSQVLWSDPSWVTAFLVSLTSPKVVLCLRPLLVITGGQP